MAQENYLCNFGPEHTDMFLHENNLYNVVLICHTNIAQENYLCNVDPQPMNNFAQENNLHCCLDLCGPTLHKEITCVMLVHG